MNGLSIHITGIVQGGDFRPFVYNLATRLGLTGWVRSTSAGVDIELDGEKAPLEEFVQHLNLDLQPLADLGQVDVISHDCVGYDHFEIMPPEGLPDVVPPILPDVSICPDCLRELFDAADRRFRYPFINCANCGPRFTIIQDAPYERPNTSMSVFPLCPDCEAEYRNSADRRFHAQPVACPECGPRVWLEVVRTANPSDRLPVAQYTLGDEAILASQRLLREGKIVAVKGLGGFRLACDALNHEAVGELRARKLRIDKPFALMMPNLTTIEQHCYLSPDERALLESPARPIVLLRRRPESMISEQVAPGQNHLGVMLPSTPLHYLLFSDSPSSPAPVNLRPLVMTRANQAEEPICTDNVDARLRLSALADAFLMHDRDIHVRTDDSIMRILPDLGHYPIRRSRGYAPFPVQLPWQSVPLLATGAQFKNTFCLTHGNQAILSHHIGDLENYEALQSFESGIAHFERLFRVKPVAIACDLHPDYLASHYAAQRAEREKLTLIPVQHDHAHIAALMVEHGLDGSEPVIGVAFDGVGYGDDGAIWGGEFLLADYAGYRRFAHLRYFPLPGGDAAARRPSRTALSLLHALRLDWDESLPTHTDLCYEDRTALRIQLEHRLNSPLTSSIGYLFTAAAALAGVRQQASYEAQAAIEFEALADPDESGLYPFEFAEGQIDPSAAITALVADVLAGQPVSRVSARFHNGLAHLVRDVCASIRVETSVSRVALSGGVWQNVTLLMKTIPLLQQAGFQVYFHHKAPANDGGLSLGQAAVAAFQMKSKAS
ncbi:MAG: carbamoyltransferase HypF [Chloroflexi bacterium HGW-Chloroflexi-6]|nr:MAG: carbamoyltransferase HypF [Chloroflexi bacterium HGW-Chloroflexi-6]